ncbi:MAG: MBL fold metallo-hydrolase [Bacteroidota bacterium]
MNPDTNAEVQQSPATELEFDLPKGPFVMVLGVAQDAGYPQMDCQKSCCAPVWTGEQNAKRVSCLAVVNPQTGAAYIIDATPDFKMQWQQLSELPLTQPTQLAGIFLTHAHMGHYTGLLHLGREAMGASDIPIYAMPRMKEFLENNGPWSQLVQLNNIKTIALQHDSTIYLQNDLRITPLQVPHRDEFSETVGYRIEGPEEKVLFIPDIDKWEKWDRDIRSEIAGVDRAYLDGSFFKNGELPNRDMSEIPHPFVEESMQLFEGLSPNEQAKVHFIHFNHTNPLLRENSAAQQQLEAAGFNLAVEGNIFAL